MVEKKKQIESIFVHVKKKEAGKKMNAASACDCSVCAKVRKSAVVVASRYWIGEDLQDYLKSRFKINRHPTRLRIFGPCMRGRGIVMEAFGTSLHTLIQRREPLALVQIATALCRAFAITEAIGDLWSLRSSTTLHCVRVDMSSRAVKLVFPFGPGVNGCEMPEKAMLDKHTDDMYRYMAPEVIKHRLYGEKCCVWVFGLICRQMALLELVPSPELDGIQFVTSLCYRRHEIGGRDTIARLQHAPVVFRHIVKQCLQKQPDLRPTFATVLSWLEVRQVVVTVALGLQSLELPALITLAIADELIAETNADAVEFLPIHVRYGIVCAVKHFNEKKNEN